MASKVSEWIYTPMKTYSGNGVTIEFPSSYDDVYRYIDALRHSITVLNNQPQEVRDRFLARNKSELKLAETAVAKQRAA